MDTGGVQLFAQTLCAASLPLHCACHRLYGKGTRNTHASQLNCAISLDVIPRAGERYIMCKEH